MVRLGSRAQAVGPEQARDRPALIVSAELLNRSGADMVIVVPLTTSDRPVRSHVRIEPPEGGVEVSSSIQCEQVRAVSSRRLRRFLGEAGEDTMSRVDYVLRLLLDLT